MALLPVIIIILIVYYTNKRHGSHASIKKSARDILDERFINGEIDEETYKRMKSVIK